MSTHDSDHEAVRLLSDYIKINTTNPPGNERVAVDFLSELFTAEGIDYKIYEPEAGRASIRAHLPGTGEKKPLILMTHIDVVPADKSEWSFDPFGGKIIDGFVTGRGALDTKGQGIMLLMALLHLKRKKIEPTRDVVFLACADEEMAGNYGAGYLIENHRDDFEAGIVLNEGGMGITDLLAGRPLMTIATAEKGLCWLKLSVTGPPGHGSAPHGENALERLTRAVNRVLERGTDYDVKPAVAAYFKNLAEGWPFLAEYQKDGDADTLIQNLKDSSLLFNPMISAQLKNTISLTVMHSGDKTNTIPSRAEAHLDCRLLPGEGVEEFMAAVTKLLNDVGIDVSYLDTSVANESPFNTDEYETIVRVMERYLPDAVITPSLLTGCSDSRFFRKIGIPTYGVMPALVPLSDVISMIHGIDEKISIENVINGSNIMTDIVLDLCGR
ncbi:MAG: M20/M25/M40 family metallo-hydrolase [Deltaproteobacteria bacterium]|nr:M20/M25/M40 family metallo-hydrolase [Candidatus Zymogenaceae bacterium]